MSLGAVRLQRLTIAVDLARHVLRVTLLFQMGGIHTSAMQTSGAPWTAPQDSRVIMTSVSRLLQYVATQLQGQRELVGKHGRPIQPEPSVPVVKVAPPEPTGIVTTGTVNLRPEPN